MAPSPVALNFPDEEEDKGESEKESVPEGKASGSGKLKSHKVSPKLSTFETWFDNVFVRQNRI